jgi:hypothetical protein
LSFSLPGKAWFWWLKGLWHGGGLFAELTKPLGLRMLVRMARQKSAEHFGGKWFSQSTGTGSFTS